MMDEMAGEDENGKSEKDDSGQDYTYSDHDLSEMGECLIRAKDIQSDPKLYNMVKKHLDGKVKKINSLDDLRRRQKEVEMRDNEMQEVYSKDK